MTGSGPRPAGVRADAILDALDALGVTTLDLDGTRVVDASPRFCELLGYTLDELRAMPDVGPTLAPAERAEHLERIRGAATGESDLPASAIFLRRDGTPMKVWLAGCPYVEAAGLRLAALVRDATDEARQQEQLAAYAEVLQRMPMGMVIWRVEDPDDPAALRVVAVNRAATAGSGRRPAELLGLSIDEVFPATIATARGAEILEVHRLRRLRDLGEVVAQEPEGFLGAGTYRRALVPLPGDMVASLVENVTARREADRHRRDLLRRILDAGEEERRRVAVGLHDDVIQTLAASLFELEAARRLPDPSSIGEALDTVDARLRDVIGRLRGLVFDLLPPELEEGLAAGVDVAADRTFAGTGTSIECRFDLAVEPDDDTRALAYRIVAEALVNARRHAEASRVVVELRSDERWLEGVVRDDGKGADELVTPPGHLGLRTMKERAQLLGGTCSVASEPGAGTTVAFRVPSRARD